MSEKVLGERFEKDGIYYTTEKARDFFHEMMMELKAIGWDFMGDATLRSIADGKMLLEGRIQRVIPAPEKPKHVCGKQGFGIGIEGWYDICPACEANKKENKRMLDAKDDS